MPTFTERHNIQRPAVPIEFRFESPDNLRVAVVQISYLVDINPSTLRSIICGITFESPDPSNWSEYPNIDLEVNARLSSCEWNEVYEFIEEISRVLIQDIDDRYRTFENKINEFFKRKGFGWQLIEGRVEVRGEEEFEISVHTAIEQTTENVKNTTRDELKEAIQDLSKLPDPDITGAIQHALAGLECLMRDLTGDSSATLGKLVNDNPGMLPKPLDSALSKLWGFASQHGRHLQEGGSPTYAEALLVVHISSAIINFLVTLDTEDVGV